MMSRNPRLLPDCEPAAQMLKALAHPERLRILCLLAGEELSVGEIEKGCHSSQSVVSQFLGRMKREGWLASRKEGAYVYYRILDPRVAQLIKALHEIFLERKPR